MDRPDFVTLYKNTTLRPNIHFPVRAIRVLLIGYAAFSHILAAAQQGQLAATQQRHPGKVWDTVACRQDPSQTYALYIPIKGNKSPLPIIYCFDPHGDGSLPVKKYRALADEFDLILVGSNNSRNGNDWSVTGDIWDHLSRDANERLKIDHNRIYTCGFSGGAKVAGYIAMMVPVIKGVIANGAGLPDGTAAKDYPFSFTAIAGEGDLNMTDLLTFSKDLDRTRTRHRLILFNGIHEWAPPVTMREAFAGLQFDAMRTGIIPVDQREIDRYTIDSKKKLDLLQQTGQWVKAFRECELSVAMLQGWTAETWFKQRAAVIASNPVYLRQQQAQDKLLAREQNIKAEYGPHFQDGNMRYWRPTIRDLQVKAAGRTIESPMYQRLLAYLSLAFYSISNHLINTNENTPARHYVELYKMADPTNSETWYFSAILDARENNTPAATADLRRAIALGFKDVRRIDQQPEFRPLPRLLK
jgi:dienelactone hydrolase